MIKNERQYRISKAQVAKFRGALEALTRTPPRDFHPVLLKAQREALESQLGDLLAEVGEYEALQAGRQRVLQLRSLDEIPEALIRARIAKGLSQKELAEKIGLKEQQIQRYEATDYATATFGRIQQVIRALDLRIRKAVRLEAARK
ncbi:MAG: helix-turn-helix transcriptional regulator [Verrucomicrobiota bacterium]|jgi:ribosome-binding protein aMBF1 (putative translation factor)